MKFDLKDLNFDWAINIWQDLKNKHLLPVAALLLVALVAVPFVLGRKKEPVVTGAVIATQSDAAPTLDEVSVKQLRPNGQEVGGEPVNPFKQPPVKTTPTTSTTAAPAPSTDATTGSTGSTDNSSSKKSSNDPSTAYKIDIKFGEPGKTASKKNVAALTPFPSADNAYIVYIGAKDGGKTAVFLISTDVKATGDGICDPSETNCKTVEMGAGDTELFEVDDADGTTVSAQYELKVTKIHK
jgi:hypothetical protein